VARYLNRKMSDVDFYTAMANRPVPVNKFSKYRGVSKNSCNPKKPYRVGFTHAGVTYYFGSFESEIEAAKAYNVEALRVIGSHAKLNVVDEES